MRTFKTLCDAVANSPLKPRTLYSRQEILQYISRSNLTHAKKYDFIENPEWGKYILKDVLFDYTDLQDYIEAAETEEDSS